MAEQLLEVELEGTICSRGRLLYIAAGQLTEISSGQDSGMTGQIFDELHHITADQLAGNAQAAAPLLWNDPSPAFCSYMTGSASHQGESPEEALLEGGLPSSGGARWHRRQALVGSFQGLAQHRALGQQLQGQSGQQGQQRWVGRLP